jgi:glycosyltransferase involved in cell wall biosynthesis
MVKKMKMVVVRGQPRMSEILFYSYFKKLQIRFIGDKRTGWVIDNQLPANIEYVDLRLKPAWLIDPITMLQGDLQTHRAWKYISGLEDYLKDVDIINISDIFYFYSGQCARLARKLNKKLVSIVWESIPNHPSTYIPPYSFQVKTVLDTADLFIARSHKAVEYLHSIGVKDNRIKMVYKGIDLNEFRPDFHKKSNKIRILYSGQLVKIKGVNELLDAFIRLCGEFDNLELWICTNSYGYPLEKKVRILAKKYPIVWKGYVEYDKLAEIYRQCDIYCQLSHDWKYFGILPGGSDWFPYAIIEAMASGLPILAANAGGIPEEIGSDNILIEQRNSDAVYERLKEYIRNPRKRIEVGKKNVERVKNMFDIRKQAEKTEEAILNIL